jgi:hypothetical protein
MAPTGSCFVTGPKGYFAFEEQFSSIERVTLLDALVGTFDGSTVYDAEGYRWESRGIESPHKKSWWLLLAAITVYNPRISVTLLWSEPKAYSLKELTTHYLKAIDEDDDILTQFVTAEELKKRVSEAQSFESLVRVYWWMETDHYFEEATA